MLYKLRNTIQKRTVESCRMLLDKESVAFFFKDIIAGQVAEPEGCLPQERAVTIPPNSDPRIIHWPPCTRLAQCGGCCGTDVLECTATRTEPATIQVTVLIESHKPSHAKLRKAQPRQAMQSHPKLRKAKLREAKPRKTKPCKSKLSKTVQSEAILAKPY